MPHHLTRRSSTVHRLAAASALLVALAFSTIAATSSRPGPPGLCASIDIGSATSLPLGADGNPDPTLDPAEIRKSLPSILGASRDPLLHMETIRRASLYAVRTPDLAAPLILELQHRVLAAEASSSSSPLAWLDAGYVLALSAVGRFRLASGCVCEVQSNWELTTPRSGSSPAEMTLALAAFDAGRPMMLKSPSRGEEALRKVLAVAGPGDGVVLWNLATTVPPELLAVVLDRVREVFPSVGGVASGKVDQDSEAFREELRKSMGLR
jgi:hypothetical protein